EGGRRELAHLHRMVDQLVVVGGLVSTEPPAAGSVAPHGGQGGGDSPAPEGGAAWRQDVDAAGLFLAAGDREEDTGAVEEAVARVEMGGANRQVPRIDPVGDQQPPLACEAAAGPGVLVDLLDRHGATAGGGVDALDVAGELPHHV